MKIRPATQSDLNDIAAIHIRSWRASYADDLPADFMAEQMDLVLSQYWRKIEIQSEDLVLVAGEDSLVAQQDSGRHKKPWPFVQLILGRWATMPN